MTEAPFTLTSGEKLILLMLTEIHEKLGIQSKIVDPKLVSAAILKGHLWALKDSPYLEEVPEEVATEVSEILSMWDYIEASYANLPSEEQEQVKAGVPYWAIQGEFRGFDGNDENSHYSVARFLIRELEKFDRFKKREINSHAETLPRYRAMLTIQEKYLSRSVNGGRWGFNVQELIEIMNADA